MVMVVMPASKKKEQGYSTYDSLKWLQVHNKAEKPYL
jgi:hypothetical protein